jgi:hypothetical protein
VRSLEQAIQIQSDYGKRVYDNHMAELSKLGEMCMGMMRDTSRPVTEDKPSERQALADALRAARYAGLNSWAVSPQGRELVESVAKAILRP